jgi:hypothetical protein
MTEDNAVYRGGFTMALGAPTVVGPLSECNADTGILVQGQLTGAQVDVLLNGVTVIASGVAAAPSQVFTLTPGSTLSPGDQVSARQTLGGDTSDQSAALPVHAAPPAIGPGQYFQNPLYACAECVWLEGLEPGAKVEIESQAGAPLGAGQTPSANTGTDRGTIARIHLNRGVGAGETLVVRQTACGVVGESESPPAQRPEIESLAPPIVTSPLKACQSKVLVSGVLEGAQVTLRRRLPDGTELTPGTCFDMSALNFVVSPPLVKDEEVTARQELRACELASPDSAPPVVVLPPEPVDVPQVVAPLCQDDRWVRVTGLIDGQQVRLDLGDGGELRLYQAYAATCTFDVPPLGAGREVTAAQELCDIWSAPSPPVTVEAAPASLPTPVIPGPLYECATVVRVLDLHPGVIVGVFSEQQPGGPINAPQPYYASSPGISVVPPLIGVDISVPALRLGDRIWAVQLGCGLVSAESTHVDVGPLPGEVERPPLPVAPLDQCMRAVAVRDVLPGALVDVRVNGQLRGTAAIGGERGVVPLSDGKRLHIGDQVDARQRICSVMTGFGQPVQVIDRSRRNIAKVSPEERALLLDAILQLDSQPDFVYPDGVTYWDKQNEIHRNAHFAGLDVHDGVAFIPWHRELVNRFEELLRLVHPEVSLHYWDWTADPTAIPNANLGGGVTGTLDLFTAAFIGGKGNPAGAPFADFESTEIDEDGIHDHIWRDVDGGAPGITPTVSTILGSPDFKTFSNNLQQAHNFVHCYIGGTMCNPGVAVKSHYAFHDPFVFLLHANVDRLWAEWQTAAGHPERLDPVTAYAGAEAEPTYPGLDDLIEPWAGGTGLEPWASDPSTRALKTYRDPSVIAPPCYDTILDRL